MTRRPWAVLQGLLRGGGRRRGKRVLIHEILTLQIVITTAIGGLAIAGLYWGGQWVLQDSYGRWAVQWTQDLNELGAPLYLGGDADSIVQLETFVRRYPEIVRVSYFRRDGSPFFSMDGELRHGMPDAPLAPEAVARLGALIGSATPHVIDSHLLDAHTFEVLAPVWTESLQADALFSFDPERAEERSRTELAGVVSLQLEFIFFHAQLVSYIKGAIAVRVLMLLVSGLLGRRALRRALTSISDLQQPIAELAKGNLDVEFKPAQHREISEIVEALESTATALGERNERLSRLANHDVLTGLYNRRRFMEELRRAVRDTAPGSSGGALFFIDLDQFKYVNDTCGHPAGDRMIRKVADQLRKSVGEGGVAARFGGDEFTVLVPGVSRRGARRLGETILEDLRRVVHVEEANVFHVHGSIGIAMIDSARPDHDDLIAQADIACREAKASGRNRLAFYSMSAREAEQRVADVNWVGKLREAIDKDALVLRYQPIVAVASGETSHHEVLLRFRNEKGRLISPDVFLPAAVRFGLMAELDAWLLEKSIGELARYHGDAPDLRLALNLSANAFEAENLSAFVSSQLEKNGVPAESVMFEITESLAMRHLSHVEKQIASLRKLGCKVALDDFGTGYSSFSYLQKLPVDYIKIDGSFIRNLENNPVDQKMVRMIAEIGREAGMQTVAEYVHNAAVFTLLGELGVDFAQGYFIGRPAATPLRKVMPASIGARNRGAPRRGAPRKERRKQSR